MTLPSRATSSRGSSRGGSSRRRPYPAPTLRREAQTAREPQPIIFGGSQPGRIAQSDREALPTRRCYQPARQARAAHQAQLARGAQGSRQTEPARVALPARRAQPPRQGRPGREARPARGGASNDAYGGPQPQQRAVETSTMVDVMQCPSLVHRGKRFDIPPSSVDFSTTEARQDYLYKFSNFLVGSTYMIPQNRSWAVNRACEMIHNAGIQETTVKKFQVVVDGMTWDRSCKSMSRNLPLSCHESPIVKY